MKDLKKLNVEEFKSKLATQEKENLIEELMGSLLGSSSSTGGGSCSKARTCGATGI